MKKFLSVILLLAVLILVGGQEKVSAYDIYCGTYSDGSEAYLATETIQFSETEWYDHITCRVKAIKNGTLISRIDYFFTLSEGGGISFNTSDGQSGIFGGARRTNPYPITSEIFHKAYKYVGR